MTGMRARPRDHSFFFFLKRLKSNFTVLFATTTTPKSVTTNTPRNMSPQPPRNPETCHHQRSSHRHRDRFYHLLHRHTKTNIVCVCSPPPKNEIQISTLLFSSWMSSLVRFMKRLRGGWIPLGPDICSSRLMLTITLGSVDFSGRYRNISIKI